MGTEIEVICMNFMVTHPCNPCRSLIGSALHSPFPGRFLESSLKLWIFVHREGVQDFGKVVMCMKKE